MPKWSSEGLGCAAGAGDENAAAVACPAHDGILPARAREWSELDLQSDRNLHRRGFSFGSGRRDS